MKIRILFLTLALLILLPFGMSYYKRILYRPYFTVIGFANMCDGIGRQSVEIIDSMKDFVSIGFRASGDSNYEDVPLTVQSIMKQKYPKFGKVVLYEDLFYPSSHLFFEKRFNLNQKDQIRLAYSMFESSELPKLWVHNLNRYFDAVVVPDRYHIDVYKNSGVTIPIFVLPLGLNLKPFLNDPIKKIAHHPFVFATFGTSISRKNHETLINAFYTAFGDNPNVRLWINSRYSREDISEQLHKQIKDLGVNNIILTNHPYKNTEYRENFHKIDCYVSISQSEGFSIQPREAMALGIPCIVSDNTAQSTICKSGLVKTISCPTKEIAYYEHFKDIFGFRYQVDFSATVSALKEMYLHYDQHLLHSEDLRKWASQYDYDRLKPLYHTLIKPKKILLEDHNSLENDILITNSKELYIKYKSL